MLLLQNGGADLWRDGRAGAGGLWRDHDICGVIVCSLPYCLCQQYRLALHNSIHQVSTSNEPYSHKTIPLQTGIFQTLLCVRCRCEEQCLVRSGLVQLLDSLCSLSGQRECSSNEKQTKKQKVATMAWAAFQVLANRCIEWEKVEGRKCLEPHTNIFCVF